MVVGENDNEKSRVHETRGPQRRQVGVVVGELTSQTAKTDVNGKEAAEAVQIY